MKQNLIDYIADHRQEMLTLLKKLVLIQSGSYNKTGLDRVARLIVDMLIESDIEVKEIPQENYGNILIASTPAAGDQDNILLIGHMDTVFPEDTAFNWWREDEENAYGPGVIDMKGGLVAGIYALKALKDQGLLDDIPLRFIFNPDEEIGSPCSQDIIASEARKSAMAFVLECGGLSGEVVTGRKGRIGVRLEVFGKAGHAAFASQDKPSAILALAHKIIALEALNRQVEGLTVNVGQIRGGIGANTVAEYASADVDIRIIDASGADFFRERLAAIVEETIISETFARAEIISSRPPMEQTEKNRSLFRVVADQARKLNLPIQEEFRQGVSDANIVASENIPVIDGLGPIGSQDHSDREFMLKESLIQRCQLVALSIVEAWQRYRTGELFN